MADVIRDDVQHRDLVLENSIENFVRKMKERDHVHPRSLHNARRGFWMFGYVRNDFANTYLDGRRYHFAERAAFTPCEDRPLPACCIQPSCVAECSERRLDFCLAGYATALGLIERLQLLRCRAVHPAGKLRIVMPACMK